MIPLRDENPNHGTPYFVLLLVLANFLVFFYQLSLGPTMEAFVMRWAMIPVEVVQLTNIPQSPGLPPFFSLFTSMFLHGGWMHLIGNMWFLWIFGDNLENFLGHRLFFVFYLITGFAAGLVHVWMNPSSPIPTIGASGAVSGVLGAYLVLYPKIRIQTLLVLGFYITIIRVPALFFLGLWFLYQILGNWSGMGQVAYGAHIGGFVAGLLFVFFCSKKERTHPRRYDPWRERRF